jgi:iron complex transport system ATP-binding protein
MRDRADGSRSGALRNDAAAAAPTVSRETSQRGDGEDDVCRSRGLVAAGLHAGYGRERVLHGIDACIPAAAVTALIGPNGSGKSTLLRCFTGALRASAGAVVCDGISLTRIPIAELARRVAYVPQETPAPYAFTVQELVSLAPAGRHTQVTPVVNGLNAVDEALDTLDLLPLRHRSLTRLSGGERHRAAIARGLAQNAPYLLLDEPTAHLDLKHQRSVLDAVRARAAQGVGVLLVLHEIDLAAHWADTILLLHQGRVAAHGRADDVLTSETLSGVYDADVRIVRSPDGRRFFHAARPA